MKILLIRPFSVAFTKPYFTKKPPFNLGYLSAYLKRSGHEVKMLDFGLMNDPALLSEMLRRFDPALIGINAYTPSIPDSFDLAKNIKSIDIKYKTVIGGPHSTAVPEETLKECKDLDFVVIGEGEATLLDLCEKLESKGDVASVKGICCRDGDRIIRTEPRELIEDIDTIPFPDRESIAPFYEKLDIFDHNFKIPLNKIMEVITSRGCTAFCTFCTVHRAYREKGRSLRLRSAENVLEEIEAYRSKHDIRHVQFLDDSFTIDKIRIRKIIKGLKDMGLSWNCDTRVNLLDRELVREMVESGCKKVSLGVESGSEKILNLINKNITLGQIRDAFKWCYDAKLETIEANFLIGSHPDETAEDVDKTRRLIRELNPQRLLVSVIVPFPGTKVREQMEERSLIYSNDWRKYILMNDELPAWRTTNFSSEELRDLQNTVLAEFYFGIKNILRNLHYIRSFSLFKAYLLSAFDIAKGYAVYRIRSVFRNTTKKNKR